MDKLLVEFLSLGGVAALIAAVISVLKYFGVIGDGSAGNVSLTLSTLGFATMVFLKLFAPDVNIAGLNDFAQNASNIVLYVLGFFMMVGLPAKAYGFYKNAGFPFLGYSHSGY